MRRRPNFSNQFSSLTFVVLSLAAWPHHALGQGNIRTDGTVGAAQNLTGPTYLVPQTLGTRSGSNLFHSFSVFNVGSGETARFTTTDSFSNVITRVTGLGIPGPLQPSLINGTIQLSPAAGAPNFFFINPAGVTFGAGASVDVPAAFHVSTAHYLKFPDGNFYADPSKASTFSSAPPEAFGFLGPGNPRGKVTIDGAVLTPNVALASNATFQFVAGDVEFKNGGGLVGNNSGEFRVVAMGDAIGEVGLSGTLSTALGSAIPAGSVSLTSGGLLVTGGSLIGGIPGPGGDITVAAGDIAVTGGGNIVTYSDMTLPGGSIDVRATRNLTIDGNGSQFLTQAVAQYNLNGNAGSVNVNAAGQLSLLNGGRIASFTNTLGNAGPITVTAGSILPNSSYDAITSVTQSTGSAGSVTVSPARLPNIVRDGTAGPSAATQPVSASGVYVIPQTFGLTSGSNLFHSFGTFNLDTGETARFTTTDSFANVINRVTGGTTSGIYGRIELQPATGSAPNFFFINPAGVTFGAGASVNVPAAFYVSTAHYLKFADTNGSRFYADKNQSSALSSASPQAFGFLGASNPRGMVKVSGVSLGTPPNAPFQIVAGDVAIDHGGVGGNNLGDVRVIAMGDAVGEAALSGTVPIAAGNFTLTSSGALGTGGGTVARRGGDITVAAGDITISGTGTSSDISTYASPTGGAGNIDVLATRNLTLDGTFSGITTQTLGPPSNVPSLGLFYNMTGDTGSVNVRVGGQLTIGGGARIYSFTTSPGNGRAVTVDAGSLVINPLSNIEALTFSTGNAASITVNVGTLTIDAGGDRNTGIVSTTRFPLGQYFPHGATPQVFGNSGDVKVTVADAAALVRGGIITANTFSSGDGGTVTVDARSLTVNGQIGSIQNNVTRKSPNGPGGNAGTVNVNAESLIVDAGQINSDTYGIGDAGAVKVNAGNLTMVNGGVISSSAAQFVEYISTGNGGSVQVSVTGTASISSGSQISSSTYTPGKSGTVTVTAGSLTIDGQGASPNQTTGITSQATRVPSPLPPWRSEISHSDYHPTGDAGSVQVTVTGAASISNGGVISSSTVTPGGAGAVTVNAGTLTVDGANSSISAAAKSGSSGQTGDVTLTATNGITLSDGGSISIANDATVANPGAVVPTLLSVAAPSITVDNASITAATSGNVAASNIVISSPTLSIVNAGTITSDTSGAGRAGTVTVNAGTLGIRSAGAISSSTSGSGNAGTVAVNAGSLSLDEQGQITSLASPGSMGDAGSVRVAVTGQASVLSGSVISSSTSGAGAAGTVVVNAGRLTVDGAGSSINAAALATSSGQTGNVTVAATDSILLNNGGKLSIENNATVADPASVTPTLLSVSAPTITLLNSSISAASTGNVAASGIQLDYGKLLFVDPSFITTSANTGNGGSIVIQGGGPLWLDGSQITTSAGGGIGGDITISVPFLIMNTGFIQANTLAGAAGGNVSINANAIIASGGLLNVGGLTPFAFDPNAANFNVIQAAAPTGLSGNIAVTAPVVNVSGSLAGLTGNVLSSAGVGRSLCSSAGGSSLAQAGRGGMPASSSDLLTVESAAVEQAEAAPAGPDLRAGSAGPIVIAQCP